MRAIRTDAQGWKKQCLQSADTNERFELHGIKTRHHVAFCVKLCVRYKLKTVQAKTSATFIPLFE